MTPGVEPPSYDGFAEDFERHAAEGAYNALYDRPAVLALLGEVAGQRLLDAGCGPGLYAEELVSRGGDVVGADGSPEMVRLAKRRLGELFDVRVHDLERPMPWLEDGSFDAALMALVISHINDRVGALREIWRVLRPGGRFVVSTHHPTSDWIRLGGSYFQEALIEEDWHDEQWHVRYWRQPLQRTVEEFTESGFVIDRLVEPRPHPEMAARYPEDHAKLTRQPGFIAFRLLKP